MVTRVNISKKNDNFAVATNTILLFSLFTIIIVIALWGYFQEQKEKAPLVIDSDGQKDPSLYTEGEVDNTYATSGYDFSGLQMPCVPESMQGAVPNLPESYLINNCNSLERRICVENFVKGGGICLSTLGGTCRSLFDCANNRILGNTPNACINNICVNTRDLDTINQPCINDFDCQATGQTHVCDKEKNVCKINYFPYDTGCLFDEDCLTSDENNDNICLFVETNGLGLVVSYTENLFTVTPSSQTNLLYFTKGSLVSYINSDDTFTVYRLTSFLSIDNTFNAEYVSGIELTPGLTGITIFIGNTGGEQLGVCASKIPRGGKVFSIAGVEVPCEDGLIKSEGFCVLNTFFSTEGVICDRRGTIDVLKCQPDVYYNQFEETIPLTCLGNISVEERFAQNFNYTYPDDTFREGVKFLGLCSFQTQDYLEECDPTQNNCQQPYLCISAESGNRTTSFCSTDFNSQSCAVTGECYNGYSCGEGNICVSEEDGVCLANDDCEGGECTTRRYLFHFDLSEGEWKRLFDITDLHSTNVNVRYGNGVVTETNIYQDLPTVILCWSRKNNTNINRPGDYATMNGYTGITSNIYSGDQLTIDLFTYSSSSETYTQESIISYLYPPPSTDREVIFSDVLVNDSNQIYVIYKKNSENDRVRKVMILTFESDNQFTLGINNGFEGGERVIYRGNNFSEDVVFYLNRTAQTGTKNNYKTYEYYLSTTSGGPAVAPSGSLDSAGRIISYSNSYTLQAPEQSSDAFKAPLIGMSFESGDQIELDGNLRVIYKSDTYNFEDGDILYLGKTADLRSYVTPVDGFDRNGTYMFQVTDTYQESQGSVPFVSGNRTPFQEIFTPDSSETIKMFLNNSSDTYSISLLPSSTGTTYIVKNEDYYLGKRNGINASLSYNFSSGDQISFSLDGNNLLINKELLTDSSSRFNIAQKLSLSSSSTFNSSTSLHQLASPVHSGGVTTNTFFVFEYLLTGSPPIPRSLYFDSTAARTRISQIVDYPLSNDEDGNSITTLSTFTQNQALPTNTSPPITLTSSLEKTVLSENSTSPPTQTYPSSNLGTNYFEMEIINDQEYDGETLKNTYLIGQRNLVFRNEEDIETILKYGWSELVFVKLREDLPDDNLPPRDFDNNIWGEGQITLVVTQISEYDVTIQGEYLVLQTNIPLTVGNGSRGYILENGDTWRLYPYNIYPLYFKNVFINVSGVIYTTYLYNFYDLSGVWTSTASDDDRSGIDVGRTSYNKLFTTELDDPSVSSITSIYVNASYGNSDGDGLTTGTNPRYIELPNSISILGSAVDSTPSNLADYPPSGKRNGGTIFGYLYNINWNTLLNELASNPSLIDGYTGKAFIKDATDYQLVGGTRPNNDQLSYVRPIFSGTLRFNRNGGDVDGQMFAINNIYLSNIPKSLPNAPLFNGVTNEVYYTILDTGRVSGDLMLGINSFPYFPYLSSGTLIETLDQSYSGDSKWPSWIIDNRLVIYKNIPNVRDVYLSVEKGNLGGKFNYYVMAIVDNFHNLYYFSSGNGTEDVTQNRGIPTTKGIYAGSQSLIGGNVNPTNQDLFAIMGDCVLVI